MPAHPVLTAELRSMLLERVARGEYAKDAARELGFSPSTLHHQARHDDVFRAALTEAHRKGEAIRETRAKAKADAEAREAARPRPAPRLVPPPPPAEPPKPAVVAPSTPSLPRAKRRAVSPEQRAARAAHMRELRAAKPPKPKPVAPPVEKASDRDVDKRPVHPARTLAEARQAAARAASAALGSASKRWPDVPGLGEFRKLAHTLDGPARDALVVRLLVEVEGRADFETELQAFATQTAVRASRAGGD